ncbi:Cse1-domain-containing protein [Cladochytrium replicatum]|nr:Cse1-domain-containing protein [Cladochytrium replicatum]
MDVTQIQKLLAQTFDPVLHADAERQLKQAEQYPGFALVLLQIVESQSQDPRSQISLAAALLFKNFIRKHWSSSENPQEQSSFISAQDRVAVKSQIVRVMISSSPQCQATLSEAVSEIAKFDFPENWDTLIKELVFHLRVDDLRTVRGVLQTAQLIFDRWRSKFADEAMVQEIKFVLDEFVQTYAQLFMQLHQMIQENAGNPNALLELFQCFQLMTNIFYDFNFVDLPEHFEDNEKHYMEIFLIYLEYQNPALPDLDDAGPLEGIKAKICEIVDLYVKRYEEEFTTLNRFIEAIWRILTSCGNHQKYDEFVCKAMRFLTSVVREKRHMHFFNQPALSDICEKIVLRNMEIREVDEEVFEDEPIEYVRREVDGSEAETRRRGATELVRGLLENFSKEVTAIFSSYVAFYLDSYKSNPVENWKSKDTAFFLTMALSARAQSTHTGVTKTNEYIQILPILTTHVLPDIEAPIDGIHPVIKVGALKLLTSFRSQLKKEQLLQVLPLIVAHLDARNPVVYTYASVSIERILAMRLQDFTPMFGPEDFSPLMESTLGLLFELIVRAGKEPQKIAANDYLMRAIMRTILTVQSNIAAVPDTVTKLVGILEVVCVNPSNPKFTHYMFESLGALIWSVCRQAPKNAHQFEQLLFPSFQTVLQNDVTEIMTYVFQILAQLFEFHTEAGIPSTYESMLGPLLTPSLWQLHGNVPALVRLLKAYLRKGAADIVAKNMLQSILGVFQMLIQSKITDTDGIDLLEAVFENVQSDSLSTYTKGILTILLGKLQTSKSASFKQRFMRFVCFWCSLEAHGYSADGCIETFDQIQPGLFSMLLQQIIIPTMPTVSSTDNRRVYVVGLTRLLTLSSYMLRPPLVQSWVPMMNALIKLVEMPSTNRTEDLLDNNGDDGGYQTNFSRLATVSSLPIKDEPKQSLTVFIGMALSSNLTRPEINELYQAVDQHCQQIVLQWLASQ